MEIPAVIRKEALLKTGSATPDKRLIKILTELGKLTPGDLIFEKSVLLKNRYRKLHELHTELFTKYGGRKAEILASYYKAVLQTVQRALEEKNICGILAVLCTRGYFPISFADLFPLLSPNHQKWLTEVLLKLLQSVKTNLSVPKTAPYHEREMLKKAEEAVAEKNIEGLYSLIQAMEMTEIGLHNFVLQSTVQLLAYADHQKLCKVLGNIVAPFQIILLIHELAEYELTLIANHSSKNEWLSFELIRLIDKKAGKTFTPAHKKAVENQLNALYNTDINFFKQTIAYFEASVLVMSSLAGLLLHIPEAFIRELFQDCFTWNVYNNRVQGHEALLGNLEKTVSETKLKIIVRDIHSLWDSFLNSLLRQEDYYQFDLLLTDFADYVVAHFILNYSVAEIINEMNSLINSIANLEAEWFTSVSKETTKYHWYGSRLYLLSVAYKHRGINDSTIRSGIQDLITNSIQIVRYKRRNETLAIELAQDNIK